MKGKKIWVSLSILLLAGAGLYTFMKTGTGAPPQGQIVTDVPVSVTTVKRQQLASNLSFVGTVNANNDVNVVSETQGVVQAVYVKAGQYVKAGDILVHVDDQLKKSSLAAAEITYQKEKRAYERSEALYQENSISAAQLDAARLALKSAENHLDIARRQARDTRIASPISGILNARLVDVGAMVSPGTPIANVVDISTLKVKVSVGEREAFQLRPGARVEITTDVYPTQKFEGYIDNVASKADEAHTYPVEIRLPNSDRYPLKAGLFARVTFASVAPTESLVIPRAALVGSIKNPEVYVVQKDIAFLRPIVVGTQSGDLLEVKEGLKEGDTVVTNGQNNLANNTPVVIVK